MMSTKDGDYLHLGRRLPVCKQGFGLQGLAHKTFLLTDSHHIDNMRQSCKNKKVQKACSSYAPGGAADRQASRRVDRQTDDQTDKTQTDRQT